MKTDSFERNITVKLSNQVITSKDLEAIDMNQLWKKELSLIIWVIDFLIILLGFTKLIVVEKFNKEAVLFGKKVINGFNNLFKKL